MPKDSNEDERLDFSRPIYPRLTETRRDWLLRLRLAPDVAYRPDSVQKSCLTLRWSEYVLTNGKEFKSYDELRALYGDVPTAERNGWKNQYHHRLTAAGAAVLADHDREANRKRMADSAPAPVEPVQRSMAEYWPELARAATLEPEPEQEAEPEPESVPAPVAANRYPGPVRLTEMLRCAEREAVLRRRVNPWRVQHRKMTEAEANREIILMQDIADYLRREVEGR